MSFVKGLKRAFGFSTDGDEIENDVDYFDGSKRSGIAQQRHAEPLNNTSPAGDTTSNSADTDAGNSNAVVDYIVELINGNLAPSVKQFLNVEQQKKFLAPQIEQKLGDILHNIEEKATNDANLQWQSKFDDAMTQLDTSRAKLSEQEKTIAETRQKIQQLELQRKATETKVNELEARNAQLESDHEQFDLENKSLLNKVKVMKVREEENEQLNSEVSRLTQLANELRTQAIEKDNRIVQLEKQLEEANSNLEIASQIEEKMDEIEVVHNKKEQIIATLKEQIAGHDKKTAELNNRIEQLKREQAEYAQARKRHDVEIGNQFDKLRADYNNEHKRNEELVAQINSLVRNGDQTNNRAGELQKERDDLAKQLVDTQNAHTLTRNKLDKANREIEQLKAEIEENRTKLEQADKQLQATAATTPASDFSNNSTGAPIDIDDIDWLEPVPLRSEQPEPEPEPEPEHTSSQPLADERQMSLF